MYTIMLCAFCCTAFFGCRKVEPELVFQLEADSEERIPESPTPGSEADAASRPANAGSDADAIAEGKESGNHTEILVSNSETLAELRNEQSESTGLFVYVCGCVEKSGVYTLEEDARICDAIAAAGGMTADAAEDYWNLAEKISDGDMIYVPSKAEAKEREAWRTSAKEEVLASGGSNGDPVISTGGTQEASPAGTQSGKININTADERSLTTLPGIGEARASMIVSYRSEHGFFAKTADIKNVSGIGDTLYENIKNMITVNEQ